jgi:hypothetical protein
MRGPSNMCGRRPSRVDTGARDGGDLAPLVPIVPLSQRPCIDPVAPIEPFSPLRPDPMGPANGPDNTS